MEANQVTESDVFEAIKDIAQYSLKEAKKKLYRTPIADPLFQQYKEEVHTLMQILRTVNLQIHAVRSKS